MTVQPFDLCVWGGGGGVRCGWSEVCRGVAIVCLALLQGHQFAGMLDISQSGACLLEVGLDLGEHGVLWAHHQGRMVAHLPQVLQRLWCVCVCVCVCVCLLLMYKICVDELQR